MKVEARLLSCAAIGALTLACSGGGSGGTTSPGGGASGGDPPAGARAELRHAKEVHLADIRQLTRDAGENAEAYWSFSGKELIFQSARPPYQCDQIFRAPADGSSEPDLVSTGGGRTTCSFFFPGDQRVLYSSTHLAGSGCPPAPDHSQGYVWALYDTYDIFTASADGSDVKPLTSSPGYDAEATVCGRDGSIIFTSTRDGDIELYRMDKDGKNVVRLTETPGYDGGAFFSADCSQIVWRASRPEGGALADYKRLLAQGLVRPSLLELWVANADGSEARQVTHLGAASFAPFFHPSGKRILFSTNYPDARGREFDIWAIDVDGTDLERITHAPGFDGFPMFSPDGKQLAFASNRNQAKDGQTDVYVATWVESAPVATEPSAADRFAADVAWLADDAREGRGVGTKGLDVAADWLADRMKKIGLEGGMEAGSFFQTLDVPVSVTTMPATQLVVDGKPVAATDFAVAGFSPDGKVAASTVAMGYGIAAKEIGYDDWGNRKAKGKVVVVRRFAPKHAAFADKEKKNERRYGELHAKAFTARQRGAVGLIVVDAPEGGGDEPALPPLLASDLGRKVGIPVIAVKRAVGEKLLRGSHRVSINVALAVETKPTRNVVGVLRAAGQKKAGAIFVGAHYDHLGYGGEHSLEPKVTAPHNGADDNASGTAALLAIARDLVARRADLGRDVYLVAFTAEELGLVGSKEFVAKLPPGVGREDILGMINLDMVGRMRDNAVALLGTDTAGEWTGMVEPACAKASIRCELGQTGGWGPSDHSSFYAEKIPVLYLTTKAHSDYHKTSDDADRIHAGGGARIAAVVADITVTASRVDGRLTYRAVEKPLPVGDRRSFNASLGTIPSYTDSKPGVMLDGVRAGGPAEKAGLRKGDRILQIGDVKIMSVQEMVYVLDASRPGEKVFITFERAGKTEKLEAVFGTSSRSAHPAPPKK